MPLFARNTNNDLLLAIEHIKVQVACGYAMESILLNLGKMNFGKVSRMAKGVMKRVETGVTLTEAFKAEEASYKNLTTLFDILRDSGPEMTNRMGELSERILKETALTVDTLIDNLAVNLNRLMIIMSIPLVIFFVVLLQDALFVAGFDIPIPAALNQGIIGVDLAVLFVVLYMMRYE